MQLRWVGMFNSVACRAAWQRGQNINRKSHPQQRLVACWYHFLVDTSWYHFLDSVTSLLDCHCLRCERRYCGLQWVAGIRASVHLLLPAPLPPPAVRVLLLLSDGGGEGGGGGVQQRGPVAVTATEKSVLQQNKSIKMKKILEVLVGSLIWCAQQR